MLSGSVLVCGSRSLSVPAPFVASHVSALCPSGWLLLSGGARGVDSVAPAAAALLGWEFAAIRPEYALFGRSAPLARDDELVSLASFVVAFWDGRSRGTGYTLARARALGRPFRIFLFRGP